jgi:hypothetical protein
MITALGLERFVSDVNIEGSSEDTTSHTSGRMTGRMTVIARVSGRRLWTVDQKLLMLRDAFGSGGDVRRRTGGCQIVCVSGVRVPF